MGDILHCCLGLPRHAVGVLDLSPHAVYVRWFSSDFMAVSNERCKQTPLVASIGVHQGHHLVKLYNYDVNTRRDLPASEITIDIFSAIWLNNPVNFNYTYDVSMDIAVHEKLVIELKYCFYWISFLELPNERHNYVCA